MRDRKGFLLALVMLMIPVSLLMVFSVSRVIFQETGFSMGAQARTKAFYVCQAGLNTAYHVFSTNNFRGHTHESDGSTRTSSSAPDFLQAYTQPALTLDSDGWYEWSWDGADPKTSFTRGGAAESYRFQIFLPSPGRWTIVAEGNVGGYVSRQEQTGSIGPIYEYTVFDNGNSTDFSRPMQHTVEGKVHANGDLFLRPWSTEGFALGPLVIVAAVKPANLNLKVDSLTSAGHIIRTRDHLGNPEPSPAYCKISKGDHTGPMVALENSFDEPGGPYDSNHPDWRDPGPAGAIQKYGGTVIDSELGAVRQGPPSRQTLTPGGYYDQKAGLRIDGSTSAPWCTEKKFYNQSEAREVTVKEIDVAALQAAGGFPANGIIYASTPVRLTNAHKLPGDMTLASCAPIYTKGDFNKDDPDGSGPNQRHSAALMTSDRVFNLTSSFDDADSYSYKDPLTAMLSKATDPPLYSGDPAEVLEINSAICDGSPSEEVRAWQKPAPGKPNSFYVSGEFKGTKLIADWADPGHPGLKVAYPVVDKYLENLQNIKIRFKGATVHNRFGLMSSDYGNSEAASNPRVMPWIVKSGYLPPQIRDQAGDAELVNRPPPGAPNAARKLLWRVK